ncbi:MAG: hypothetical protein IKL65_00565 [Bacilli bacterium]|nr:hypothetical protein [Bacilli bacterium]MBR6689809.1 hypothetical protein [Bacilli bacterium]
MNITEIMNTIRDNASEMYRQRIPEATQNNIESVQESMCDPNNAVVVNEFMNTLLNMIIKQVIHAKLFSNPLKALKKGKKPLGDTIEEIYNNFIKAEVYDQTGANLLQRKLPDTKTVFHRMNRQDKYKVTVSPEELFKAFSSWDRLQTYIGNIINTLYNSSELDEFVLTKQLLKQAYDNKAIKVVDVPDPLLGDTEGKQFIRIVKTVSGDMVFPNSNNNAYLTAQDKDDKPIITFSRKNEQVLIIDNPTNVSVDINVLASIFNMSVAEFNDTKKIVIDAFPDPDVRAALVDEAFFQIYDDLFMFKRWENPEGLYDNYYLHVWQTLAYSPLVNAVIFKVQGSDQDEDALVEEFDVTLSAPTGVSLSNKNTKVEEGTFYSTKLKGIKSGDTVAVTMGIETVEEVETPIDITDTAYDSTTKTVTVDIVTDDITITVTRA